MADARLLQRERARRAYGPLFAEAATILHAHDPIGAARAGAPPDEYEPEVATILPLLIAAAGAGDVRRLVHLEMVRWCSAAQAGDEARYDAIAEALWQAYQRHARRDPVSLAAPAWHAGGLDHHVGRLLHEALPPARRPAWAGGILRSACRRLLAPAEVTRLLDLTDEPARWGAARRAVQELRELALAIQRGSTRRERALVDLAALVAKIVANAGGGAPPFDPRDGWLIASRLRELTIAMADRAYLAEAERALLAVTPAADP